MINPRGAADPEGRWILADWPDGKPIRPLVFSKADSERDRKEMLGFSMDERLIAIRIEADHIAFLETATGRERFRVKGEPEQIDYRAVDLLPRRPVDRRQPRRRKTRDPGLSHVRVVKGFHDSNLPSDLLRVFRRRETAGDGRRRVAADLGRENVAPPTADVSRETERRQAPRVVGRSRERGRPRRPWPWSTLFARRPDDALAYPTTLDSPDRKRRRKRHSGDLVRELAPTTIGRPEKPPMARLTRWERPPGRKIHEAARKDPPSRKRKVA